MENKNEVFVKDLQEKLTKIQEVRKSLESNYNNRENSIVVRKLREAEHWLSDQIEALK